MRTIAALSVLLACACAGAEPTAHIAPTESEIEVVTVVPECPIGMIHVKGSYCMNVNHTCKEWLDPPSVRERFRRCLEYFPATCVGQTLPLDFCIDAYEFSEPNGFLPMSNVSWVDASSSCMSLGKRLCSDEEWTLACEGSEMLPFPYGLRRDNEACYTDKYIGELVDEMGRLRDLRAPVTTHERCESPYGVRNMVGNVGEWVMYDEADPPFRSGGKGGWWCAGLRSRCRPITLGHDEGYSQLQVGFRCCDDR